MFQLLGYGKHPIFMRFVVLAFLLMLAAAGPVTAADSVTVQQALSGTDVRLADGGRAVLNGIFVPEAEQAAAQSALQKNIDAEHPAVAGSLAQDRYGRVVVQAWQNDHGQKLQPQVDLLRAGLAFVWPPTGEEQGLDIFLKAENDARQARRGLWQEKDFADLSAVQPDVVLTHEGHFAFVTGKVLKAARVRNKVYLNFADDWHHDFAIEIVAHDLRDFRHAKIDPLVDYTNRPVRVRGWIERNHGPMIVVTHPAQIQRLD